MNLSRGRLQIVQLKLSEFEKVRIFENESIFSVELSDKMIYNITDILQFL